MNLTLAPTEQSPSALVYPQRKRFTLTEYHRLIDLGFFQPEERIELIGGDLVTMASKGTAHILCCQRLLRQLPQCLGEFILQCQDPIMVPPSSEPEPDFAVLAQDAAGKSTADQVVLVIEIADSSLQYDREVKAPLYASGQIPHYWIFNILDRQVECYRQPQQDAQGRWRYAIREIVLPDRHLTLPPPLSGAIELAAALPEVQQ
jgi:Uma2 family endonuclease